MVHEKRVHQDPASRMESKGLVKWSPRTSIHRDVFGRGSKESQEGGAPMD